MWRYGLPVPSNASIAASTTAESRSALVASPGLAVWMAPSASLSRLDEGGPVVQVDDGRDSALLSHGVGLGVVADEAVTLCPLACSSASM